MRYDVAIIGAGVHGASAAFHLAGRGTRTLVIEKDSPAAGPTGRSSGICRAYYTNHFLARMARDSIAMLEQFGELTGGRDGGFHRTGFLFLHPVADEHRARATVGRLEALGVRLEVLDQAALAAGFPAFDLGGVGVGVWEPGAGYADPSGVTTGLLGSAVDRGVDLMLGQRVVGIRTMRSGVEIVVANGDTVACDRALIAAGPWTRRLARMVNVDLPLTVERHVVALMGWGSIARLPFGHADLASEYYCKPEGEQRFCLGWLHPASHADPDDDRDAIAPEEMLALAEVAAHRVPMLADAEIRGGWTGLYDVSPDWQPVIGKIAERIFVDAGTSGHGFKLAPALGAHVADLVTGASVDPALEQFHPRRFDSRSLLAAGFGRSRILG